MTDNLDALLNDAYDKTFPEDNGEVKTEEEVEEGNPEEVQEEDKDKAEEEIAEDETTEDESQEEIGEDEKELEEKEINLSENLRGVFSKDYIELLDSIDDVDLRNDLIEAGKKQRADLDRKRLEFGESKKIAESLEETIKANNLPYQKQNHAAYVKNLIEFDALFTRDPLAAIEALKRTAKIEDKKESVQEDDDDYRTTEEIHRDTKIKTLEDKLQSIEREEQRREAEAAKIELNTFVTAKNELGELKHPHFEQVKSVMHDLFARDNTMTFAKAYKLAVRMDDELFELDKQSLVVKQTQERKEKLEKAKKLKRFSSRSSGLNSKNTNPDSILENLVADFVANS